MDKRFIIGILVGIILMSILYLLRNTILGNIEIAITIIVTFLVTAFLLTILTYSLRRKIFKKAYELVEDSDVSKNASILSKAIISKNKEQIAEYTEKTTKSLLQKYFESQTRMWTIRVIVSIFGIIGALLATIITIQQNKLIENQNNYFVELEKPILSIDTYGLLWKDKGQYYNVSLDLNLENIGKRAASNVKYELEFYERLEKSDTLINMEKYQIQENLSNDLHPSNKIAINSMFNKIKNKNDVLVYLIASFEDDIRSKTIFDTTEFSFKLPAPIEESNIKESMHSGLNEELNLIKKVKKKSK